MLHQDLALTPAEWDLRAAYRSGKPLHLPRPHLSSSPPEPSDDPRRLIHAWVIRDLLLSNDSGGAPRLRLMELTGATIKGCLDLQFAEVEHPVRLMWCSFDTPPAFTESRLRSLALTGSTGPGVAAQHLTVQGDCAFDRMRLTGPLLLNGAHLGDDLRLTDSAIAAPARPRALDLTNADIKGTVYADGLAVTGTTSMDSLAVAGSIRLGDAALHALPGDKALIGDGMRAEGRLDGHRMWVRGEFSLLGAHVLELRLRNIQIRTSGNALTLDRLDTRGSVFCDGETYLVGCLHAIGMKVGGSAYLGMGRLEEASPKDEPPRSIDLRRAKITGDLKTQHVPEHAKYFSALGRIDLAGAWIGGDVDLSGACLEPAQRDKDTETFTAESAKIDGNLYCADNFNNTGTLILANTKIGGLVHVSEGEQAAGRHPHGGPRAPSVGALRAAGLAVAGDLTADTTGAIDLSGTKIAGTVDLRLERITAGHNVCAVSLRASKTGALVLNGGTRSGWIDLRRASVNYLQVNESSRSQPTRAVLDGLKYVDIDITRTVEEPNRRNSKADPRLEWVAAGAIWTSRPVQPGSSGGKIKFASQPYQQLAATYQRAGRDPDARRVLRQMYRDRNKVMTTWRGNPLTRLWNYIQDGAIGYGYSPLRALGILIVLVAVSTWWFGIHGMRGFQPVETAILSLGFVLPGSGYEKIEHWTDSNIGDHVVAAILVLIGLLLGATVVAALARAIKR